MRRCGSPKVVKRLLWRQILRRCRPSQRQENLDDVTRRCEAERSISGQQNEARHRGREAMRGRSRCRQQSPAPRVGQKKIGSLHRLCCRSCTGPPLDGERRRSSWRCNSCCIQPRSPLPCNACCVTPMCSRRLAERNCPVGAFYRPQVKNRVLHVSTGSNGCCPLQRMGNAQRRRSGTPPYREQQQQQHELFQRQSRKLIRSPSRFSVASPPYCRGCLQPPRRRQRRKGEVGRHRRQPHRHRRL